MTASEPELSGIGLLPGGSLTSSCAAPGRSPPLGISLRERCRQAPTRQLPRACTRSDAVARAGRSHASHPCTGWAMWTRGAVGASLALSCSYRSAGRSPPQEIGQPGKGSKRQHRLGEPACRRRRATHALTCAAPVVGLEVPGLRWMHDALLVWPTSGAVRPPRAAAPYGRRGSAQARRRGRQPHWARA